MADRVWEGTPGRSSIGTARTGSKVRLQVGTNELGRPIWGKEKTVAGSESMTDGDDEKLRLIFTDGTKHEFGVGAVGGWSHSYPGFQTTVRADRFSRMPGEPGYEARDPGELENERFEQRREQQRQAQSARARREREEDGDDVGTRAVSNVDFTRFDGGNMADPRDGDRRGAGGAVVRQVISDFVRSIAARHQAQGQAGTMDRAGRPIGLQENRDPREMVDGRPNPNFNKTEIEVFLENFVQRMRDVGGTVEEIGRTIGRELPGISQNQITQLLSGTGKQEPDAVIDPETRTMTDRLNQTQIKFLVDNDRLTSNEGRTILRERGIDENLITNLIPMEDQERGPDFIPGGIGGEFEPNLPGQDRLNWSMLQNLTTDVPGGTDVPDVPAGMGMGGGDTGAGGEWIDGAGPGGDPNDPFGGLSEDIVESGTRAGRARLFDTALAGMPEGTPFERAQRERAFDPWSRRFAIGQGLGDIGEDENFLDFLDFDRLPDQAGQLGRFNRVGDLLGTGIDDELSNAQIQFRDRLLSKPGEQFGFLNMLSTTGGLTNQAGKRGIPVAMRDAVTRVNQDRFMKAEAVKEIDRMTRGQRAGFGGNPWQDWVNQGGMFQGASDAAMNDRLINLAGFLGGPNAPGLSADETRRANASRTTLLGDPNEQLRLAKLSGITSMLPKFRPAFERRADRAFSQFQDRDEDRSFLEWWAENQAF